MSEDIPESVAATVDRIAAALYRGEPGYARELLNKMRLEWEADGRRDERNEQAKARDIDLEMRRRGEAVFETRDGLTATDALPPHQGYWPHYVKRPCRTNHVGLMSESQACVYTGLEIRTYEWNGSERTPNGLPIYREQP